MVINDTITDGTGADVVYAGDGNDSLSGGDWIEGVSGANTISGGDGAPISECASAKIGIRWRESCVWIASFALR